MVRRDKLATPPRDLLRLRPVNPALVEGSGFGLKYFVVASSEICARPHQNPI